MCLVSKFIEQQKLSILLIRFATIEIYLPTQVPLIVVCNRFKRGGGSCPHTILDYKPHNISMLLPFQLAAWIWPLADQHWASFKSAIVQCTLVYPECMLKNCSCQVTWNAVFILGLACMLLTSRHSAIAILKELFYTVTVLAHKLPQKQSQKFS